MKSKLLTLEEIGQVFHWGTNGTFFNTQIPGFPKPVTEGTLFTRQYDLEEVHNWDRTRPVL